MISRKGYSLPDEIGADLSNTINLVKNHAGTLNYRLVPIDAIEFDPDNPRELKITRDDVINGIKTNDPLYEIKSKELESLLQMSETVKEFGVRNPIEIYKHGAVYRLIHGERRCLSSLLALKKEIPAKILNEKPNSYEIKMLQLIENVQREDLSLSEYINNIQAVIDEYKINIDPNVDVTTSFIEKIVNKSRAQSFNILTILKAPEDVQKYIKSGEIKNLEKAAVIANVKDIDNRQKLIHICINGSSLSQIKLTKEKLNQEKQLDRNNTKISSLSYHPGLGPSKIILGDTQKRTVISKIIKLVLKDPQYKAYGNTFKNFHYEDYRSCSAAFKTLIKIMEDVEDDV